MWLFSKCRIWFFLQTFSSLLKISEKITVPSDYGSLLCLLWLNSKFWVCGSNLSKRKTRHWCAINQSSTNQDQLHFFLTNMIAIFPQLSKSLTAASISVYTPMGDCWNSPCNTSKPVGDRFRRKKKVPSSIEKHGHTKLHQTSLFSGWEPKSILPAYTHRVQGWIRRDYESVVLNWLLFRLVTH